MNRDSRRSAAEAAEALLEAGRTEPVLKYDVELGLARHHDWLRSEAPLPEWAGASVGAASKSLVSVLVKTVVSAVLVGTVATAAWYATGRQQPSAATPLVAGPVPAALPSALETPRPLPVPEHSLPIVPPNDEPIARRRHADDVSEKRRRVVRLDAPDKRAARLRVPKEQAPVRAEASQASDTEARAAVTRAEHVEPTNTREVAASPVRESISARPEAAPRAEEPGDLAEMQQVAKAEQLLERSPARALALVRQGNQQFAQGYFQQERAYIAIMALIRLGRIDEARSKAASFAKQFPALPYGARIRSALDAAPSSDSRSREAAR